MQDFNKLDIQKLEDILNTSVHPVIVSHLNPDGDAIGSSTALAAILRSLGASPAVAVPTEYPSNLEFTIPSGIPVLVHSKDKDKAEKAIADAETIICIDLNGTKRSDSLGEFVRGSKARKVLIDHHLDPAREEFDLVFSETEISSASEYLYWILMAMDFSGGKPEKLPAEALRSLMTGMTTDTNNFANSVFPTTLKMAGELLGAGVDRDEILTNVYNSFRETRFRLMGHLLKDELTLTEDGVAYMILSEKDYKEYDIQEGETEAFVNIPLGMKKIRMSIFIKEMSDGYRVSIRSKKGTSANLLAHRYFNGGGHEQAAGGHFARPEDFDSCKDIAAYIEKVTREFFRTEK